MNNSTNMVGFHTRNIPHLGHLFIQKKAYNQLYADGIFISPITNSIKKKDFDIKTIIDCYQLLIKEGYYANIPVFFNCLLYYPRFAGPREAAFTAIIRQNYGCHSFIIGRDHAGLSGYYKDFDYKKYITNVNKKILIELVCFDAIYYFMSCKKET